MQSTEREKRGAERKRERTNNGGDKSILILTTCLALFGILMVYSASYYTAQTTLGDRFYYVKKQAIGVAIGAVCMFVCSKVDCRKLNDKKVAITAVVLSFVFLLLVFVPSLGVENYGATRWIGIGGITVQPSEFAKYGFVLFSAWYASNHIGKMRTFLGILPILLVGGGICLLIMLEPNMSVTVCVGLVMLAMIFLGGANGKIFFLLGGVALCLIPILILAEPYRLLRLSAFLDPWASPKEEGYQLIQSLYALGGGGWFGTGLFHSRQKYRFLPFAESDFILAIIGEEFGFVGIVVLFSVCGVLIYRGIKTAGRAENFYSYLLAVGITLVYGVQTVVNALVVSGAIPPTGLPLPLISHGNTSIIVSMGSMGLLYAVGKVDK